jgi:hypothetical protein
MTNISHFKRNKFRHFETNKFTGSEIGLFHVQQFPNPYYIVGLKLMNRYYTGSCIRVRRSSDNVEQDFGFNATQGLDTSGLLSFCGAGDGFIRTWYDQSGNGRDFVQGTTANQPRIVNAGALETGLNGLPAIYFDGTNDSLRTTVTYNIGDKRVGQYVAEVSSGTFLYGVRNTADGRFYHSINLYGYGAHNTTSGVTRTNQLGVFSFYNDLTLPAVYRLNLLFNYDTDFGTNIAPISITAGHIHLGAADTNLDTQTATAGTFTTCKMQFASWYNDIPVTQSIESLINYYEL